MIRSREEVYLPAVRVGQISVVKETQQQSLLFLWKVNPD